MLGISYKALWIHLKILRWRRELSVCYSLYHVVRVEVVTVVVEGVEYYLEGNEGAEECEEREDDEAAVTHDDLQAEPITWLSSVFPSSTTQNTEHSPDWCDRNPQGTLCVSTYLCKDLTHTCFVPSHLIWCFLVANSNSSFGGGWSLSHSLSPSRHTSKVERYR